MQLALVPDSELGPAIAYHIKSHKHLCAITAPMTGKVAIYAGATDADALIAARKDYPSGVAQQYERISNDEVRTLRDNLKKSPLAITDLGRVADTPRILT